MKRLFGWCIFIILSLMSAGCVPAPASLPAAEPTPALSQAVTMTTYPAVVEQVASTATPAKRQTPTSPPPFPPQSCSQPSCTFPVSFPLQRPIAPIGNQSVEPSYRYGSTQNHKREVHHGVEFINKAGVPVLAAADGMVTFAGSDDQQSFASKRDFYGKVIILRHLFPGIPTAVYTVYGHLLKINVQAGEEVRSGQKIGEVGLGGVAAGTHLHFEVRYGKNDYSETRNPELWFPPLLKESGVLAGKFTDPQGTPLMLENFVLEPLEKNSGTLQKLYFSTYEDPQMFNEAPWGENFGINDLPAGKYLLTYIFTHPLQLEFEILPGQVTFLNIPAR